MERYTEPCSVRRDLLALGRVAHRQDDVGATTGGLEADAAAAPVTSTTRFSAITHRDYGGCAVLSRAWIPYP